MKWVVALIAAAALAPMAAHADQADRFGTSDTIVPGGRIALEFDNVQPTGGGDSSTTYNLELSPGMLYFVTRNLAIGGSILATYSTTGSGDSRFQTWGLGIAPEAGFNVPISRSVSFFPTLGLAYLANTAKAGPSEEGKNRRTRVLLGMFMPFLFHFDNFFMGLGPYIRLDVSSKSRSGRLSSVDADKLLEGGLQTTLGGWF